MDLETWLKARLDEDRTSFVNTVDQQLQGRDRNLLSDLKLSFVDVASPGVSLPAAGARNGVFHDISARWKMPEDEVGVTDISPALGSGMEIAAEILKRPREAGGAEAQTRFVEDVEARTPIANKVLDEIIDVSEAVSEKLRPLRHSVTKEQLILSKREAGTYSSQRLTALAGKKTKAVTKLEAIVHSLEFELASGFFIVTNLLVMAVEVEYGGLNSGYMLGYPNCDLPATQAWPNAVYALHVVDIIYNCIFVIELFMRVGAEPKRAIRDCWIWLDVLLVGFGLLMVAGMPSFGMEPTTMRIVRLARMVRILKVVRTLNAFDALFILVRSIQASVSALFWSFAMLGVIQFAVGMVLSQMLRHFVDDKSKDEDARRRVYAYFGTFSRTVVSMFEITMANWVPSCRLLMENVSEYYGIFYLVYRCMFCFAVVKVIAAVFINETQKAAISDDELAIRKKQRSQQEYASKVHEMFKELDLTGDGQLSFTEFQQITSDDFLHAWSSALDIDTSDLHELFQLLDDGDGVISIEEFTRGLKHWSGDAKKMDIATIINATQKLDFKLTGLMKRLKPVDATFGSVSATVRDASNRFAAVGASAHKIGPLAAVAEAKTMEPTGAHLSANVLIAAMAATTPAEGPELPPEVSIRPAGVCRGFKTGAFLVEANGDSSSEEGVSSSKKAV